MGLIGVVTLAKVRGGLLRPHITNLKQTSVLSKNSYLFLVYIIVLLSSTKSGLSGHFLIKRNKGSQVDILIFVSGNHSAKRALT